MFIPTPTLFRNRSRQQEGEAEDAPPANANVMRIFLSYDEGIVMLFDRPVIVDLDNPPTTWSFNGGTWIQAGYGFNFPAGGGTYFLLNSPVNPGNAVVLGANDPGARTPQGGYVNGGSFVVEDL